MKLILPPLFLLASLSSLAQVGIGTTTVDNSAVLELKSTSKGILVPRMNTSQRTAIPSPAQGLMVYDTDVSQFFFYDGTAWVQAIGPAGANGTNGKTILSGAAAPTAGTGVNGDFYLRLNATRDLYGPKAAGVWPAAPVSLLGPAGTDGTNGKTILNGTTNPAAGIGVDGDFYINTASNYLFGPKAAGAWPGAGVSLTGPQGPSGLNTVVALNKSYYPTPVTAVKGNWVMFPGAVQVALLGTQGAMVNATVTAKIATGGVAGPVSCNVCYSTNNITGTPVADVLANSDLVVPTLNATSYAAVTLNAKVLPAAAGIYWVGPCFTASQNLDFMGVMGYIVILQ